MKYVPSFVFAMFLIAISGAFLLSSCVREYDKPEYVEVDTAETAFVVPLEGDGTQQSKFHSEKYLEERKVAAKPRADPAPLVAGRAAAQQRPLDRRGQGDPRQPLAHDPRVDRR